MKVLLPVEQSDLSRLESLNQSNIALHCKRTYSGRSFLDLPQKLRAYVRGRRRWARITLAEKAAY